MDKRIDERFRKPRRTKGTPFYVQRNYWAAGIIAFGGICWYLWELLPQTKKLKRLALENLQDTDEIKAKALQMKASIQDPALASLLSKIKEKEAYKNEPPSNLAFFNFFMPVNKTGGLSEEDE